MWFCYTSPSVNVTFVAVDACAFALPMTHCHAIRQFAFTLILLDAVERPRRKIIGRRAQIMLGKVCKCKSLRLSMLLWMHIQVCNKYGVLTFFGRHLSAIKTVFKGWKDGLRALKTPSFTHRKAAFCPYFYRKTGQKPLLLAMKSTIIGPLVSLFRQKIRT